MGYPPHGQRAIDAATRTQVRSGSSTVAVHAGGQELRKCATSQLLAKGTESTSPYRSQLEADYAAHLETLKENGEIVA